MNVPPDKKGSVIFKASGDAIAPLIERERSHIMALAKLENIVIDPGYVPARTDAAAVMTDLEIFLPLKDLIDLDKERARLQKEIDKVTADLERVDRKLGDEKFTGKAPAQIVDKEKSKRDALADVLSKLRESLDKLS
jgi:valyl-tRNA synthetase